MYLKKQKKKQVTNSHSLRNQTGHAVF